MLESRIIWKIVRLFKLHIVFNATYVVWKTRRIEDVFGMFRKTTGGYCFQCDVCNLNKRSVFLMVRVSDIVRNSVGGSCVVRNWSRQESWLSLQIKIKKEIKITLGLMSLLRLFKVLSSRLSVVWPLTINDSSQLSGRFFSFLFCF